MNYENPLSIFMDSTAINSPPQDKRTIFLLTHRIYSRCASEKTIIFTSFFSLLQKEYGTFFCKYRTTFLSTKVRNGFWEVGSLRIQEQVSIRVRWARKFFIKFMSEMQLHWGIMMMARTSYSAPHLDCFASKIATLSKFANDRGKREVVYLPVVGWFLTWKLLLGYESFWD